MGGRSLAVAAAAEPTEPAAARSAAMETPVEPDAMSEDEMVEVAKTVPVKEASSNDDEGVTEPIVIRIAISGVILIQPSGIGQAIREVIGIVAVDVGWIAIVFSRLCPGGR